VLRSYAGEAHLAAAVAHDSENGRHKGTIRAFSMCLRVHLRSVVSCHKQRCLVGIRTSASQSLSTRCALFSTKSALASISKSACPPPTSKPGPASTLGS
jgi:hypothetical protein